MSVRLQRVLIGSVVPLAFLVQSAFAQTSEESSSGSGEALSGSGAIVESLSPAERFDAWRARAEGFRTEVLRTRSELQALRRKIETVQSKRADGRRVCQESIRKANRDARLRVQLKCYGEDLTFTRELLDLRSREIALLPGVSAERRQIAVERGAILDEAIGTILDGLDVGVLTSEAEALETKHNLGQRYLAPAMQALAAARLDRLGAWIAHVGSRLADAREGAMESPKLLEAIDVTMVCLADTEDILSASLDKENNEGTGADMRQAQTTLKSCIAQLRTAAKIEADIEKNSVQ